MAENKVQPLRTSHIDDGHHPPIESRLITPPPGLTRDEIYALERRVHLRLIVEHEARLSAMAARVLMERQGPIEKWCAVIFDADPEAGAPEIEVHMAPRESAIESLGTGKWGSETRDRLAVAYLPDRLDVLVEAKMMLVLASAEIFPAFPVTRGQAEAMNLPAQLLFAKGDAFLSVGEAKPDEPTLAAAVKAHNDLVEESMQELFVEAIKAMQKHDLRDCAGVVLALGPEGHAVTVVPREMARRLVAHEPFLARKLDRPARRFTIQRTGEDRLGLPIVVWARGHVSVQARDVPKKANDVAAELRDQ
jgi:hypothetical protein